MTRKLLFYIITAICFIAYFLLLRFIWETWMPFNILTDYLALFIILVVLIPLSAFSSKLILDRIIKL